MADKIEEMVEPVPSEEVVTPTEETVVEENTTEEFVVEDVPVIKDEPSVDNVDETETEAEEDAAEEPKTEPAATLKEDTEEEIPIVKVDKDDNVKKIDEQLSIISEVRQELANVYKSHQTDVKTIESLQSQISSLESKNRESNKKVEQLTGLLDTFKTREDEANKIAYSKRLEKLSSDFSKLGQTKNVEQLSTLSEEVITEFESVTAMALDFKSEEKLNSVTTPTQSTPKPVFTDVKAVHEKISDKDFLKGVLNTLASQQGKSDGDAKRILNM